MKTFVSSIMWGSGKFRWGYELLNGQGVGQGYATQREAELAGYRRLDAWTRGA